MIATDRIRAERLAAPRRAAPLHRRVTVENAAAYLAAGAAAVGISFGTRTTEEDARRAVEAVASARSGGEREEER